MKNTKIEWADHTMNFWVGCTKVSPACDHCYAETWAKRSGHPELWTGKRRRTAAANWQQPYKWNRAANNAKTRPRVFTCSLADFFDNQIPDEWRADAWDIIGSTPNLEWMILTKRPQNIAKMLPTWDDGFWPNVWLGTTVENQEEADRRIPYLLAVPAKIHFLSMEPLIGPVNLFNGDPRHGVDWVITGGESGPHARSSHPDWFRSLRDQCDAAGVPFYFKQWGEWIGGDYPERVGKKRAGRLLDGIEQH